MRCLYLPCWRWSGAPFNCVAATESRCWKQHDAMIYAWSENSEGWAKLICSNVFSLVLHRNNTKLSLMHTIIIISIESILFGRLPLQRYNSGLGTISGSFLLASSTGTNGHLKHFVSVLDCKLIHECLKSSVASARYAQCESLCWLIHMESAEMAKIMTMSHGDYSSCKNAFCELLLLLLFSLLK